MKKDADEYADFAVATLETVSAIEAQMAEHSVPEVRRLLKDLKQRILDGRFFTEALDAKCWIRECGLHYTSAASRFESATGTPPGTFLRECRLETAARLLTSSEVSVAATAELTGFAEHSSFCRAFEQWCGLLPQEFRERSRWLPGLRLPSGHEIFTRVFLDRLRRGKADDEDVMAVLDWLVDLMMTYMADPPPEVLAVFERRLALELWETRLAPRPTPKTLEVCRLMFKTDALEVLLAEKGFGSG